MGACLLALMAWVVRPWRPLMVFAALPMAAYLLLWPAVHESPRWLLVAGRKVCQSNTCIFQSRRSALWTSSTARQWGLPRGMSATVTNGSISQAPILYGFLSFVNVQGEATAALAAIAVGNRTKLPEQPLADMGSSTAVRCSLTYSAHSSTAVVRVSIISIIKCASGRKRFLL